MDPSGRFQYNAETGGCPTAWFGWALATGQGGFSGVVFLLIDLAAGEALVQDAERIVGRSRRAEAANRPDDESDNAAPKHQVDEEDPDVPSPGHVAPTLPRASISDDAARPFERRIPADRSRRGRSARSGC